MKKQRNRLEQQAFEEWLMKKSKQINEIYYNWSNSKKLIMDCVTEDKHLPACSGSAVYGAHYVNST